MFFCSPPPGERLRRRQLRFSIELKNSAVARCCEQQIEIIVEEFSWNLIWQFVLTRWNLVGRLEHLFPSIGNHHPNWLSYFFRGVETTNQKYTGKSNRRVQKSQLSGDFFSRENLKNMWWIMMNATHTPKIPYAKCIIYIPCVEKLLTRNIANLNHDIFFEHNLALLEKGKQEWSRLGTAVVKQSQGNPWAACIFICVLNLRVSPNLMVFFSMFFHVFPMK